MADGTIVGVVVGRGYSPNLDGMPITEMNLVTSVGKSPHQWASKLSATNYLENIRRRLVAQKVLNNYNWPSSDLEYELRPIINRFDILFNKDDRDLAKTLLAHKNIEVAQEFVASPLPNDVSISLTLSGLKGLDYPLIDVQINNKIYKSMRIEETQTLKFVVEKRRRNLIKITMTNKNANDTLVENGQIATDKTVKINELIVDEVRLQQPLLQSLGRVKDRTGRTFKFDGLYSNSTWSFYFENPVNPYFIKKKKFYWNSKLETTRELLNKISHMFSEYVNH